MMNGYIHLQVLAMCIIAGIAAGCFQMVLWKKQELSRYSIKIIAFYIGVFYGVLSLLKVILGEKDMTLFESFGDISVRTYLHYTLPILIVGVVVPIIIKFIFRRKDGAHILSMWDACFFMIGAIIFAVTGRITNLMYLGIFAVSVVLTLILEWKLEMKEGVFTTKVKQTMPMVILFVITVVLYLPGEMYLNNIWEFHLFPGSYAGGLLLSAIVYLIVYTIGAAYFLTTIQVKLFSRILFALTIMGYLQNMFLNGYMLPMDGTVQTWALGKCLINGAIWIVLIAGILIAGARLRDKADKVYRMLCIYVGLIQIVSLVYITVTSEELAEACDTFGSGVLQLTSDNIYELGSEKNIVVFILDWYDEQILEQILEEDNDFLSPLDGFTCYTNATSLYAYTTMAIPYLLTGVEWEYDMSQHQYCHDAFENGNVLADIKDMGYNIEVYTDADYLTEDALKMIDNSDKFDYGTDVLNELYVMTKTAKYQMAPFAAKQYYWYTTHDLYALTAKDDRVYTPGDVQSDMDVYEGLKLSGLQTGEKEKLFKMIHMHGAHPPFGIDESSDKPYNTPMLLQARESMEMVYEYIKQMKEIGVYDSATIMITADHGENYLYDPVGREELVKLCLEKTSSPILMVKHPNQSGDMRYTNAPVSQKEVVAEIMNAINPALDRYGKTLEEIGEEEERERIFVYKRGTVKYVKSRITGDVSNPDSWEILEGLNLDQLK